MAWRQLPDSSYIQAASVVHAFVQQNSMDSKWYILGTLASSEVLILSPPFNTQANAQTALDNFITATGGTV